MVVDDLTLGELVFPESLPVAFLTAAECPPGRPEVVLVLEVESVCAAFVVAAGVAA